MAGIKWGRRSYLAFCVSWLCVGQALADGTWDVMQGFGWTGTWSIICSDPPSAQNPRLRFYVDSDGVARRSLDRGADSPSLNVVIESARIITATTMGARVLNADPNWGAMNGTYADIVLVKENGRTRTLSSRGSDGVEYIKDGIVVSSGKPIPWLEQCQN